MTISNSSNSTFNGKFSVKNLYVSGKNTEEASLYITPKTTQDGSKDIEINSTKNSNRTCINSNNLYLKSSLTNNILAKESITLISNFSNINSINTSDHSNGLDSSGYYNTINNGNSLKMNSTGIKLDSNLHFLAMDSSNIKMSSNNDLNIDSVKTISIKTTDNGSNINIVPETDGSLQLGKPTNKNTTLESNHIELSTSKDISGNPPGKNIELTGNDLNDYGGGTAGLILQSNAYGVTNTNDSNGTIVAKCAKFTITGDLDVQGETTTLNTETTIIEDINIQLGVISREISLIEDYIPKITHIEKQNNEVFIDLNQITDIKTGNGQLSWIKDSTTQTLECKIDKQVDGKYKITDNNGNPINNSSYTELNGMIEGNETVNFVATQRFDSSNNEIDSDKYIELNTYERDDLKNIQPGDYIHIKSKHYNNNISGNGPLEPTIDIPLKVKTVNDGSLLLDIDDQPGNFDKDDIKNKINTIKSSMSSSSKPVISKLKTKQQINNAGLDIEFFDNTNNIDKRVTKYIRYHSNSTDKTETENTWNVNAPIRMDPQDEIEDTNGDGKLMPITIGKRPAKPTDKTKKRGWSIIANDNSLVIRNEDSNDGDGQIVFTARSRD